VPEGARGGDLGFVVLLTPYPPRSDGVRNRRLLIKGSIIVLPATYIGCLLVAFLKCIPFRRHWQVFPNPGVNCMPAISPLQTIFVMVMNTVTDFYLMAIPIPVGPHTASFSSPPTKLPYLFDYSPPRFFR